MSEKESSSNTEIIAFVMFFAGFALGVEAERTSIPQTKVPAVTVAAAPAAATPLAMRGMTGLMHLNGAIAP